MLNQKNEDSDKELLRYHIIIEGEKSKFSKGKKKGSERLSCQPVLSFIKKHQNNNLIRISNTRKKTTTEFLRYSDNNYFISPLEHSKKNNYLSSKNISTYAMSKFEEIIKERKNLYNRKSINAYNKNNNSSRKNVYYQIKNKKLNIYDRSMRNLKRKEKYIEKQQLLQLEKIYSDMTYYPEIHEMTNVMKNYTPIYERALQLHNKHLMKIKLHEKEIELKKIEEENKDYEIVKQYANKKKFNEKDWENFLNKQYNEIYMKKFAEKLRDQKFDYIPTIDYKSKQIILNKRKKELFIDDIHTRLYNDFNNKEERRLLRMCNSMPSFKPLLNKNLNKNIFNPKKKYNHVSSFDKQLTQLIDKKLKSLKNLNKNSKSQTKFTSQSFVNNTEFKNTNSKFNFNSKIFKNTYNNNKNSRNDENYIDSPIFISHNFVGNTTNNKSQNLSNIESAKNYNNKYRNIQNYKLRNKNINKNP